MMLLFSLLKVWSLGYCGSESGMKVPSHHPPVPNYKDVGGMWRGGECHHIFILPTWLTCAEDVGLTINYSKCN